MIASARYVSDILEQEGLKPNRNLGQNFFINGPLLEDMIGAVPFEGKNVLEIGPGLGALTELMLNRGAFVLAVEKDPNMVRLLKKGLPSEALTVIEGDILKFNIEAISRPFSVAGNLPYFITADIIEKIFGWSPEQMLLMVQKEAGERFFAKPSDKNYIPLGIACSLYYAAEKLGDIPPCHYLPPPGVTSTMVYLKRREDAPEDDPRNVLTFFNECFRMRRKTLINNLSAYSGIKETLQKLGLDVSVRAEALPPQELLSLYHLLKRKG